MTIYSCYNAFYILCISIIFSVLMRKKIELSSHFFLYTFWQIAAFWNEYEHAQYLITMLVILLYAFIMNHQYRFSVPLLLLSGVAFRYFAIEDWLSAVLNVIMSVVCLSIIIWAAIQISKERINSYQLVVLISSGLFLDLDQIAGFIMLGTVIHMTLLLQAYAWNKQANWMHAASISVVSCIIWPEVSSFTNFLFGIL